MDACSGARCCHRYVEGDPEVTDQRIVSLRREYEARRDEQADFGDKLNHAIAGQKGQSRAETPGARLEQTVNTSHLPLACESCEGKHASSSPIISRANPRDSAKMLLVGVAVDGVSRLRFQRGGFWYWEAGVYERQPDGNVRKLASDFLYKARCNSRDGLVPFNPKKRDIDEVLDALKVEAHLDDRFSAPCWLPDGAFAGDWILFQNVIVNAKTSEARPHTHRLWAHGNVDCDWRPDAVSPVWQRTLESVFPGDPSAQDCLEEWIGLCMTTDVWPEKAMLLLGQRRSGKSTIVHIIEKLAGRGGYGTFSFDLLHKGEFSAHGLIGKRAIVFSDVRLKEGKFYGKQWDAGGLPHASRELLLKLTGRDTASFRKMHSTDVQWEGVLPGKVTLVSNEPPNFNDDVLTTRFLKLHFAIDQEKAGRLDPHLGEKLGAELPGIAARCIRAYQRLARRGAFVQPDSGLELDRQLARARSPTRAMVLECLEVSDVSDDWVTKKDAHRACREWLRENGHGTLATILRPEDMGEHLVMAFDHLRQLKPRERFKQRTDGHRYWTQLRLTVDGRRLAGNEQDA